MTGETPLSEYSGWLHGWKECATCLERINWYYRDGDRDRQEPPAKNCVRCAPGEWDQ